MQHGDFSHHGLVNRQPASRINNQHVHKLACRFSYCRACNRFGFLICAAGEKRNPSFVGKHAQLLYGRRSIDVCRNHHDLLVVTVRQPVRKFHRGRGFARTLQTCHEDDSRGLR